MIFCPFGPTKGFTRDRFLRTCFLSKLFIIALIRYFFEVFVSFLSMVTSCFLISEETQILAKSPSSRYALQMPFA